jgi:hypothetical protein
MNWQRGFWAWFSQPQDSDQRNSGPRFLGPPTPFPLPTPGHPGLSVHAPSDTPSPWQPRPIFTANPWAGPVPTTRYLGPPTRRP